ncbi:hypothetical protein [Helicobacter pylori]|uniref:hypothetical protein n=1 Tax=Helicobacter pylori TaxID=210 RepID=UPI00132B41B7|nr:hypothetical protein [Helicobacter pylori]MUU42848.1 hypothetical protein [Helicobacter pylori]
MRKPLNHSTKIEPTKIEPIFIRPCLKKETILNLKLEWENIEEFCEKREKKLKNEALLFKF